MRETFKANTPVGFSQVFSSSCIQTAARSHITQELRKRAREETVHTPEMPTVVSDNLEACQGSEPLYFTVRRKCRLKLGRKQVSRAQTTDCMPALTIQLSQGWNLGDTIWESPQWHFQSTSCVVHGQKEGRISACEDTKGACMHESSYHWQALGIAKSEQWSPKYIYMQNKPRTFHPDESTMRKIFPTDSQLVSIYSLSISNGSLLSEKLSQSSGCYWGQFATVQTPQQKSERTPCTPYMNWGMG